MQFRYVAGVVTTVAVIIAATTIGHALRVRSTARADEPSPSTLTPDELFKNIAPAVAKISTFDGRRQPVKLGSGFFVSSDGLLVTNYHVIDEATFATAGIEGRQALEVEGVIAYDRAADLAVLKVRAQQVPFVHVEAKLPTVGEKVYAIGNPEGLTNTLSEGLVSGLRTESDLWTIRTSAAISHGSSGGPLLNAAGSVVGVTSSSDVRGQSLNFAVPAERVARLLRAAGPLASLTSAWRDPLDPNEIAAFSEVWDAINEGNLLAASTRLVGLAHRQATNAYFWWTSGMIEMQLADYRRATEMFREAVRLQPGYLGAHLSLANALALQRQSADALEEFRAAARLDGRCAQAFVGGALAYEDLGNHPKAMELLRKAAQVDAANSLPHRLLGRAYFGGREYGAAIDEFERALRLGDQDPQTWLSLGNAHFNLEHYRDALTSYARAAAIDPQNAYAHLWVGWACFRLGDYRSAGEEWVRAAELDPDGQVGRFARQNLRENLEYR